MIEFVRLQQRVGVALDDTVNHRTVTIGVIWRACAQRVVFAVRQSDPLPKFLCISIVLHTISWQASHRDVNILWESTLDTVVAAVNLSPCLLEKSDPHLVSQELSELSVVPLVAWQVVINYNRVVLSLIGQNDSIDTTRVDSLIDETSFDTTFNFCQ